MNYTMEEYASDVVCSLQQICANEEVSQPNIVSESGRAITAHHACIIMNVFGRFDLVPAFGTSRPRPHNREAFGPAADAHVQKRSDARSDRESVDANQNIDHG